MTIGSKIIFLNNLTSTNTSAVQLLSVSREEEGTIIRTDYQSAGRGQPGNSWESEKGKNLLFSIILYPFMIKPGKQFLISMAISLGIREYISTEAGNCTIKWPNDIYVKDDKIAGILIENSLMENRINWSVAGIGLNINQEVFTRGATNPVSLRNITGKTYDIEKCLNDLSGVIDKWYKMLISGEAETIRKEYKSSLYRYGHWHKFSDSSGKFAGLITDVEDDGRLAIETSNGSLKHFYFREVDFIF